MADEQSKWNTFSSIDDDDETRFNRAEALRRAISKLKADGLRDTEEIKALSPEEAIRMAAELGVSQSAIASHLAAETRSAVTMLPARKPLLLELHYNDEIDLDAELSQRFVGMPLLSNTQRREVGKRDVSHVFTLRTQDGNASALFDTNAREQFVEVTFTFGSMLAHHFRLLTLENVDRRRWLEVMRDPQATLSFLWSASRWQHDYLIFIKKSAYINLYAFSPRQIEAAVRLTPSALQQLLDWFEEVWVTPTNETQPVESDFDLEPPADPESDSDASILSW